MKDLTRVMVTGDVARWPRGKLYRATICRGHARAIGDMVTEEARCRIGNLECPLTESDACRKDRSRAQGQAGSVALPRPSALMP